MSQATPPSALTTCPNCHAAFKPGSRICTVCKLEVAQMPAFAAAKKAAQQRGIRGTQVETNQTPAWRSPATLLKATLLLAFLAGTAWLAVHFLTPKPPRYAAFPATAQESATRFLSEISKGDAGYDNAYSLIADSERSTKDGVDDRGEYVQIFHLVNEYLTAELGPDWITRTKFAPDPKEPDTIIATVDGETLHINTAQQSADKLKPHYGITGIPEAPVDYARALGQTAVIGDLWRKAGGQAAEHNLDALIGATGGPVELRHAPVFIKKMVVLKSLRDPHSATGYSVAQTDNFRTDGVLDPVVKARLEKIMADGRYSGPPQDWARKILAGSLDEIDRAAAHLE